MSFLFQHTTGQVFHETKELRKRADMKAISDAEAHLILAGKVAAPRIHVAAPVAGDPNADGADADTAPRQPTSSEAANNAAQAERAYALIDQLDDNDDLEQIGREYEFELDKRLAVAEARAQVKAAVARALGLATVPTVASPKQAPKKKASAATKRKAATKRGAKRRGAK